MTQGHHQSSISLLIKTGSQTQSFTSYEVNTYAEAVMFLSIITTFIGLI